MKVLISSLDDRENDSEVEASELNYDRDKGCFWMRCVMGDDWFQRVTSKLPFKPRLVRFVDESAFVVFDFAIEAERFSVWLAEAEKAVEHGYRTMRG